MHVIVLVLWILDGMSLEVIFTITLVPRTLNYEASIHRFADVHVYISSRFSRNVMMTSNGADVNSNRVDRCIL